jgi:AcrR family transcriptional regulator
VTTPAYSRLGVDERRRQLLEAGMRVFTERSYDTVSMSDIAREAGISKGLLYHYFSSKQDLFRATLEVAAAELYDQVRPDDSLPLQERMAKTLNAYLDWIEANTDSYVRILEDAGRVPEARDLLKRVREQTAFMIASGAVGSDDPPRTLISAALGWLWFLDGVCLDWLAHRHMTREQVTNLLLGVLYATVLTASGVDDEIDLQIG